VYVESLNELTDEQGSLTRAVEIVNRRSTKGAPAKRMLKVTLYSERQAQRILQLRKELAKLGWDGPE
jgi:hypothetical protein